MWVGDQPGQGTPALGVCPRLWPASHRHMARPFLLRRCLSARMPSASPLPCTGGGRVPGAGGGRRYRKRAQGGGGGPEGLCRAWCVCLGGGGSWHYGDEGSVQRVGNCSAGRTAQSLPPSSHRERRSVPHLPTLACGLLAACSPPAMPGTPSHMPSPATLQAAAPGPAAFPRRQQARRRPPAPAPCPPSPTSRRWACRRSSMNLASPPCPPSAPSCAAPSAESWQRASPPACSPPSEEKEEGCAVVQGLDMLRSPARLGTLPSWGGLHDDLASAVSGVGVR